MFTNLINNKNFLNPVSPEIHINVKSQTHALD